MVNYDLLGLGIILVLTVGMYNWQNIGQEKLITELTHNQTKLEHDYHQLETSHCSRIVTLHPTVADRTMNQSYWFEDFHPYDGVNSSAMHYNPNKIQLVDRHNEFVIFSTNLTECDFY